MSQQYGGVDRSVYDNTAVAAVTTLLRSAFPILYGQTSPINQPASFFSTRYTYI